jgi:hypothetical protein
LEKRRRKKLKLVGKEEEEEVKADGQSVGKEEEYEMRRCGRMRKNERFPLQSQMKIGIAICSQEGRKEKW